MQLRAGELNCRVTIERIPQGKRDAYGDTADATVEVGTFLASRPKPLTPKNLVIGRGFSETVSHESKMYYRPEVTQDCYITANGSRWYVNGVTHDRVANWTQLFLTEIREAASA